MLATTLTRFRHRLHRARAAGEDGFAMLLVLGMATVMTALVGGGLLYATSASERAGSNDVDNSLAYNAALAGVADFTARVNDDLDYCTDLVKNGGDTTNLALTQWKPILGKAGSAFRYKVTSDCSVATGDSSDIKLLVSGIAGPKTGPSDPEVRTITAEIKRPGFRDYVFFTDKEEDDPDLPQYGLSGDLDTQAKRDACKVYSFTTSPAAIDTRSSSCKNLNFLTNDTLNGKVHTNDMIRISGNPVFEATVTEGCPGKLSTDPCYATNKRYINGGGSPTWPDGVLPKPSVNLSFPADDSSVREAAVEDGCVYRGPTRIVLLATGNMSISSPRSTSTTACPLGANVAMPHNGVIFIDEIASGESGYQSTCTAPFVTNSTSSGSANSGGGSYPLADDWDYTKNYINCNQGNLWIEGTLNGIADIGTENNLYITGDIKYKDGLTSDTSDDGLGLVAQKSIKFYNPVGSKIITPADPGSPAIPASCYRKDFATTVTAPPGTGWVKTTETTSANCAIKRNYDNVNSLGVISGSACTGTSNGCAAGNFTAAVAKVDPTAAVTQDGSLCADPCGHDLRVDAAMLSIKHSISLPYYNKTSYTDNMGTLTINGSVAQYYRGGVKSGTSGYSKLYNYDKRLVNIVLPGFPQITSTFGSNGFTAEKPAYKAKCYGGWRTDNGCTSTSP